MQSQVRAPEKVPEKVPGGFGAEPWSMLMCFQRLASQHASERFVQIKRCGCWGYHRSFFLVVGDSVNRSVRRKEYMLVEYIWLKEMLQKGKQKTPIWNSGYGRATIPTRRLASRPSCAESWRCCRCQDMVKEHQNEHGRNSKNREQICRH